MNEVYSIDNKGAGNCGYYAYAISLMYALRSKNDSDMTSRIFDLLKSSPLPEKKSLLSEDDADTLKKFIKKSLVETRPFKQDELDQIQEILGPVLRQFAADQTIVNYDNKPKESKLYADVSNAMASQFKDAIDDEDYKKELSSRPSDDFRDSEVLRLSGFKKAVADFKAKNGQAFGEAFAQKTSSLKEEKKETEQEQAEEKKRINREKEQSFDELLAEQTDVFLNSGNPTILEQYQQHLAKDGVWATVETLSELHEAIRGSRRKEAKDGSIEHEPINDISPITIMTNNLLPDGSVIAKMNLNNRGNSHWTTVVHKSLLSDIPLNVLLKDRSLIQGTIEPFPDEMLCKQEELLKHFKNQQTGKDQKLFYLKLVNAQQVFLIDEQISFQQAAIASIQQALTEKRAQRDVFEKDIQKCHEKKERDQLQEDQIKLICDIEALEYDLQRNNETLMTFKLIKESEEFRPPLSKQFWLNFAYHVMKNVAMLALAVIVAGCVGLIATMILPVAAATCLGTGVGCLTGLGLHGLFSLCEQKHEDSNSELVHRALA